MDADTRHQLKTNELAEALNKLQNLRDPRLLYGLAVVGVVLVAVLAYFVWSYTQRRAAEAGWNSLNEIGTRLMSADAAEVLKAESDLRAFIDSTSDTGLAGYGRLRLAHSRFVQAMEHPEQRPAGFEEAKQLLENARADAAETPLLDSAVTFLLASTYESLGQPEEARKLYEMMKTEPRYAGPYRELADARLETMDTAAANVVLAAGSPPAGSEPAAAQPNLPQGLDPELIRQFQQQMQATPVDPAHLPVARPEDAQRLPGGVTPAEPAPTPPPPAGDSPQAESPAPSEPPKTAPPPGAETPAPPAETPPATPPGGHTAR
jgi:predicted negative regulator of RcsB-dependent stress response